MSSAPIRIYVLDVPEFAPLVEAARAQADCKVSQPIPGYTAIDAWAPIEFSRKQLGFKPAVWYGIFTGGLRGRIECFDRDKVRVAPA
jgi:hypothetical protein